VWKEGDVEKAEQVCNLIRNSGYPSLSETIHMIQDGNMLNMPSLTAEDAMRSLKLYREPVGCLRGKEAWKTTTRAVYDGELALIEKKQVPHTDIMHVDGKKFHISVSIPLFSVTQCMAKWETASIIGLALQRQVELLQSRVFTPMRVHTDLQSAFHSLVTQFKGVAIDVGGAKDYVPVVDAKIRRIKEVYRGIKSTMGWSLPHCLVQGLIAFAVS
jgi:hypothetical protein